MNVYFDIANLRSYAKQGSHQNFKACTNMLRQNFDLCFTFKKEDVQREKKQNLANIMNLMRQLTSNRGDSKPFEWDVAFPKRPLKDDLYDSLTKEQLMSVYLLDDSNINAFVQHGCLLFAAEGDEIKALSNLFIEGQMIATKQYNQRHMTDWSVIAQNASPCTDIIIVDRYLFAQSDRLYERNSYKVIEHLAKWNKGRALNIVVFTLPEFKINKDDITSVPFPTIERQLKKKLKEQTGGEHNITFVKMPLGKEICEHDRYIITNYKMFDSGDSYKYFDENGNNTSKGRLFHVSTHGDKECREQSLEIIDDLQKLIDEVKGGLLNITGDRKSNFFTF